MKNEPSIVMLNVAELKPYENNPRINDPAVEYVANSIREFGFRSPILIDKGGVIIAGHTRLKAAQKLGMKQVPVMRADDLTPEQVKAFRLADNKTTEYAQWDVTALGEELADIPNFDMSELFGFLDDLPSEDDFGDDFDLPDGDKPEYQTITLTLHNEQADLILACIDYVHEHDEVNETFGNENRKGNGVYEVVRQWAEQKKLS